MRRGCSVRLSAVATATAGWQAEVLLKAEILILILLLSACAARTSRTTDDITTTTQVKIALLNDARVGALRLEVQTFHGVVTLAGTVRSDADAQRAVGVARRVHGVRGVTSELKIVPGP